MSQIPVIDRWISYEPTGSRDVYWCHRLNEPVIIEYRVVGSDRQSYCVNCSQHDITNDSMHTFVCHVHKPGWVTSAPSNEAS